MLSLSFWPKRIRGVCSVLWCPRITQAVTTAAERTHSTWVPCGSDMAVVRQRMGAELLLPAQPQWCTDTLGRATALKWWTCVNSGHDLAWINGIVCSYVAGGVGCWCDSSPVLLLFSSYMCYGSLVTGIQVLQGPASLTHNCSHRSRTVLQPMPVLSRWLQPCPTHASQQHLRL